MKMEKEKRNFARRYKKEYHIFRSIFYMCFLWTVVNFVNYFMYRIKIVGRENIPKKGNVIFAANHVSEMDPPFLATAVNKHVAFMAKKELFGDDKRSWLIKRLGAFAVDREKPEMATFKTVRDIFETNWPLGIFPQGGTVKNKKIENIRKGFVVIAKHAKADIVPISICGFDGYAKKLFEKNVKIVIGKPISYKLDTDEIIQQWCAEICKNTGFENLMIKKSEETSEVVS
ncbi:MAG: lysophospholipid acyltransferase family protein [Candidatus Gastranaerophilaceae bacterium]